MAWVKLGRNYNNCILPVFTMKLWLQLIKSKYFLIVLNTLIFTNSEFTVVYIVYYDFNLHHFFSKVICLCFEIILVHFEHKVCAFCKCTFIYSIILVLYSISSERLSRPCYIVHKNSITFLYLTWTVSICLPWIQFCSMYSNSSIPSIVISLTTTFWKSSQKCYVNSDLLFHQMSSRASWVNCQHRAL